MRNTQLKYSLVFVRLLGPNLYNKLLMNAPHSYKFSIHKMFHKTTVQYLILKSFLLLDILVLSQCDVYPSIYLDKANVHITKTVPGARKVSKCALLCQRERKVPCTGVSQDDGGDCQFTYARDVTETTRDDPNGVKVYLSHRKYRLRILHM